MLKERVGLKLTWGQTWNHKFICTYPSLENEEDNNICDDSEDIEDVCTQEDLKALKWKEEEVENLEFILLHAEVLCQSPKLKELLRSQPFQRKIVTCVIDEANLIKEW